MFKHFHQPWYWLSKSTPSPALFISQFCQQIQFAEFSAFQLSGKGQLPTLVVNINGIVQGTEGYIRSKKKGDFYPQCGKPRMVRPSFLHLFSKPFSWLYIHLIFQLRIVAKVNHEAIFLSNSINVMKICHRLNSTSCHLEEWRIFKFKRPRVFPKGDTVSPDSSLTWIDLFRSPLTDGNLSFFWKEGLHPYMVGHAAGTFLLPRPAK